VDRQFFSRKYIIDIGLTDVYRYGYNLLIIMKFFMNVGISGTGNEESLRLLEEGVLHPELNPNSIHFNGEITDAEMKLIAGGFINMPDSPNTCNIEFNMPLPDGAQEEEGIDEDDFRMFHNDSIAILSKALKDSEAKLEKLIFSGCKLLEEDIIALANALLTNKNLKQLRFLGIGITVRQDISIEAAKNICKLFEENNTITKLDIIGCNFEDGAFKELIKCIESNAGLEDITIISNSGVKIEVLEELYKAMNKNKKSALTSVNVNLNYSGLGPDHLYYNTKEYKEVQGNIELLLEERNSAPNATVAGAAAEVAGFGLSEFLGCSIQ
jgi:hypothetical protein